MSIELQNPAPSVGPHEKLNIAPADINVGRSLRRIQFEHGVTNRAIATVMGVNPVQVVRWRNSEDMKLSRVTELARFFRLSLDEFISAGH